MGDGGENSKTGASGGEGKVELGGGWLWWNGVYYSQRVNKIYH